DLLDPEALLIAAFYECGVTAVGRDCSGYCTTIFRQLRNPHVQRVDRRLRGIEKFVKHETSSQKCGDHNAQDDSAMHPSLLMSYDCAWQVHRAAWLQTRGLHTRCGCNFPGRAGSAFD